MRKFIARFKQSPLFSTVYVLGSALSVASIMLVAIFIHVKTASIYPEHSRNELLYINYATAEVNGRKYTFHLGYALKEALQHELEDLGAVAAQDICTLNTIVVDNKRHDNIVVKNFDHNIGKVYDFDLLEGEFFTAEDCRMQSNKIMISDRLARRVFGSDRNVVGRKFYLDSSSQMGFRPDPYYEQTREGYSYEVCGVFREGSKLLSNSFAEAIVPMPVPWYKMTIENGNTTIDILPAKEREIVGTYSLVIKPNQGVSREQVKAVADNAVERLRGEIESGGIYTGTNGNFGKTGNSFQMISMGIDPEMGLKLDIGTWPRPSLQMELGNTEDPDEEFNPLSFTRLYGILMLILLLVPALNLSSLIAGNMDAKLSELSIRKAFGAPRRKLLGQLINENLWLTGSGTIAGIILAWIGVALWKDWLFAGPDGTLSTGDVLLDPAMLFAPQVFIAAVAICVTLNLAAAIIPAWMALRRPIIYGLKN